MHLQSCLHPVRIWSKHLRKEMYVPCRKCLACLNAKRYDYENKIVDEVKHHRFSHFVTLTYDEDCVPTLERVPDHRSDTSFLYNCFYPVSPVKKSSQSLKSYNRMLLDYDVPELHTFDVTDMIVRDDWNDFDVKFVQSHPRIPVGNKRDIQLFIKRLRKYAQEKFQTTLRFFFVLEYGPRTFRPHYHGLIFHDSPEFATGFRKALHQTWTLGFVNTSLARKDCPSYVAKYINSSARLPKILQVSDFKPFILCSRRPYIGSLEIESEEVREIVLSETNYLVRCVNGRPVDVTFSRSFEDRLFPKCRNFGSLNHYERVDLYGQSDRVYKEVDLFDVSTRERTISVLHPDLMQSRDFQLSMRVCHNARVFGLSLPDYVSRIERYYDWKERFLLKKQYEFQSEYMQTAYLDPHVRHLITFYPSFVDKLLKIKGNERADIVDYDKFILQLSSFGFDEATFPAVYEYLDYTKTKDYQDFHSLNVKIHHDSLKTKILNDNKGLFLPKKKHPHYYYIKQKHISFINNLNYCNNE